MPSISENIHDCRRQHEALCKTLKEISTIFEKVMAHKGSADFWQGESRKTFDMEMEKRFEEFLELMKYAENEEHFYQTWKHYVDKIHGIFDDLFEKIRNI